MLLLKLELVKQTSDVKESMLQDAFSSMIAVFVHTLTREQQFPHTFVEEIYHNLI